MWLNDGSANFIDSGQNFARGHASGIALGDLDNDGALDLYIAYNPDIDSQGADRVWLNDGSGNFVETGQAIGSEYSTQVHLGDVDTDGDLDAVAGHGTHIYYNDGSGFFGPSPFVGEATEGRSSTGVALGDLDNDSDLDIFLGHVSSIADQVWINREISDLAIETRQEVTGSTITYTLIYTNNGPDIAPSVFITDIVPADITNYSVTSSGPTITQTSGTSYRWHVENLTPGGSGIITVTGEISRLSTLVNEATIAHVHVEPVDIDLANNESSVVYNDLFVTVTHPPGNDAVGLPMEIVSATTNQVLDPTTVDADTFVVRGQLSGIHSGSYSVFGDTAVYTPNQPSFTGEVMFATLYSDISSLTNDAALIPYTWQYRTNVNISTGLFDATTQYFGAANDVALADFNLDGHLDAFIAHLGSNRVWLNNGQGVLFDSGQLLGDALNTHDIAVADVDNDGDLDVFVANLEDEFDVSRIWLNDGVGGFSDSGQGAGGDGFNGSVALGDLDADGDLDAVIGNYAWPGQANTIWWNDGLGNYSDSGQQLGNGRTLGLKLGDLDGDGDLDIVEANESPNSQNVNWFNDGTGHFVLGQVLGSSVSYDVDLGDLNGDGYLDVFFADRLGNHVWFNDGTGTMINSGQSLGEGVSEGVVLGDLDGDGDLDAYVANNFSRLYNYPRYDRIWWNDGAGVFTANGQDIGVEIATGIALGDIDNDGDLDSLVTNTSSATIWLNRNRSDLAIEKQQQTHGQAITYTLTFTNFGPNMAPNVVISDVLPANLMDVTISSSVPVTSTGNIPYRWEVGDLELNQGGIITITAVVSDFQYVENTAVITSDSLDPVSTNDQATVAFNVADLAIDKQQIADTQNITYTLIFTNHGPDTAYHVLITDQIPVGLSNVLVSSSGVAITDTGGVPFSWQVANMPISSQGIITITGDYDARLTLRNTAIITSPLRDPEPASNTSQTIFNDLLVIDTNPSGNGRVYLPTQTISATFSRAISTTSVTIRSFQVRGSQSGLHTGNVQVGAGGVWFTPTQAFYPGEQVVVGLSHDIWSESGDDPLQAFTWQFVNSVSSGSAIFMSNQVIPDIGGRAAASGDIDNDGDLDLVVASYPVWDDLCRCALSYGVNRIWLNDGSGGFTEGSQLGTAWTETADVKLADFDEDGDLDLLFITPFSGYTSGPSSEIWFNDGTGVFQFARYFGEYRRREQTAAVGDIDGDNDIDIIMGTGAGYANTIWLNDGSGVFAKNDMNLGSLQLNSIELADMDNDGDLDAVTQYDIWVNDGEGAFTPTQQNLNVNSLTIGDVNQDAYLDIITTNGLTTQVWFNDQAGYLVNSNQTLSDQGEGLVLGDWDGDDDLDLYISRTPRWAADCACEIGGEDRIWLNQGGIQGGSPGEFIDSGQSLENERGLRPITGDWDGDGDLDVFVPNLDQSGRFWFNSIPELLSGFSAINDSPNPLGIATNFTGTVQTGNYVNYDWDFGDGRFGEGAHVSHVYTDTGAYQVVVTASNTLNQLTTTLSVSVTSPITITGLQAFNDSPADRWQRVRLSATLATGSDVTYNWDFGDGSFGAGDSVQHSYAQTGHYTAVVTASNGINTMVATTPVTIGLYVIDPPPVNAVIAPQENITTTFNTWLGETSIQTSTYKIMGSMSGMYSGTYSLDPTRTQIVFDNDSSFKPGEELMVMVSRDVKSENDRMHASPYVWQTRVAVGENDGPPAGLFISSTQQFEPDATASVALADVDLDGDLDLYLGNTYASPRDILLLNDGNGTFTASDQLLSNLDSRDVAFGDLNGDGYLDAFVIHFDLFSDRRRNEVWFNNGQGQFIRGSQEIGSRDSFAVALGDVDGDGDLDAVVANSSIGSPREQNTVWLNNGNGYFIDSGQELGNKASNDVALGDLDSDGDLDAFFVNIAPWGTSDEVWFNDGNGQFTHSGQTIGHERGQAISLGDLDGDDDLDAIIVNSIPNGTPDTIWLNDGSGFFTTTGQLLGNQNGYDVALGDADNDGDLDAIIANYEHSNKLWLNDGNAHFTDSDILFTKGANQSVAFGDIDNDGDLDAVFGSIDPENTLANEVWFNQSYILEGLTANSSGPTLLGGTTAFTATVSTGTNVTYTWNFGDGNSESGASATHVYSQPGVYMAVVTATDGFNTITTTTPVTIYEEITITPGIKHVTRDGVLEFEIGERSPIVKIQYIPLNSPSYDTDSFVLAGAYFQLIAIDGNGDVWEGALPASLTLTLNYDETSLPSVVQEANLQLYRFDESVMGWIVETAVSRDTSNNKIVVILDHLSEFALMTEEDNEVFIYLPTILK